MFVHHLNIMQVKRDNQTLARSEQEILETRRENENLQTVIETLKRQNKNLQIEKDTEVEALNSQVIIFLGLITLSRPSLAKISPFCISYQLPGFLPDSTSYKHSKSTTQPRTGGEQETDIRKDSSSDSGW